jgi:hypothetical protein
MSDLQQPSGDLESDFNSANNPAQGPGFWQKLGATGSQLAQATGAPLQYLSAVPGAYSSGQSPDASTLGGLVSGGGAEDDPSMMSSILSGLGGL